MIQDANISLAYTIDNSEKKGELKMQHNNGNVSLSFYPEVMVEVGTKDAQTTKKIAQIPDHVFQLSDFTMIEMDAKDILVVTLSGSRSHCLVYFQADNDRTKFFNYIGQKVCLKHSDCNPCVFLLESLDSESSGVAPFMATVLPKPQSTTRISLSNIDTHGLMFKTDETVKEISAEQYRAMFDEEGRIHEDSGFPGVFFNVYVDPAVSGELWGLLLKPEDAKLTAAERKESNMKKRETYMAVKRQWQSTTRRQWNNHPELRKLVDTLEKDLKAHASLFSEFEHPKAVMKIAFNIFLTLSVYNWDGATYVEGLVTFLAPFLNSFVKDADETTVTKPNGEKAPIEEVEADLFSCFSSFYDQNELSDLVQTSKQPFLKSLFMAINGILEASLPELLQILYQKHAFSLDFLRDDCSKWFATCFESQDVRRLWMSSLSFTSTFQFFQCFTVSLLFSLIPAFMEMNPLNSEEFVRRFHKLKKNVDLNLLLVNTEKTRDLKPTTRSH